MSKPVILTGLRANAEFTLGNYLGAILPMVELQQKHATKSQLNMFVPDLHSFTTPIDHRNLHQQIIRNMMMYCAAGLNIDDDDTYIYRQSYISAHSELTLILNNFAYFGELQRMTQFKEKSLDARDNAISAGLFDYPVLMAADILLYGAQWVIVGDDQRQHLELTRDLALRLNNKFDQELFIIPAEWEKQLIFAKRDNGIRIRSLKNPEKKMSKSVDDPAGTILLNDSPNDAAKKVMGATTDSLGAINFDWEKQPGISNLLQTLALLTGKQLTDVIAQWNGNTSYGQLKTAVAGEVVQLLTNLQAKLAGIDEAALTHKLEASELQMRNVANQRLYAVQVAVGLRT